MPDNAQETKTVRRSYVVTFSNHPPIRLWGEFDAAEIEAAKKKTEHVPGDRLSDYEDGTLWDKNQQWGHNDVCYYITKSGKKLYWGSYNSGESYNGHDPKTSRKFLKTVADIKAYIEDHSDISEWHRVSHRVDPTVIVDSDLL